MNWVDESGPIVRVPFVLGLGLIYYLIFRFIRNITRSLAEKVTSERRFALKIQSQVIVSNKDMANIIVWLIRSTGLLLAIVIAFSFLNVALGLFEWGRSLAGNILLLAFEAVGFVVQRVIDYIPSLLVIIVVLLIVRFILHVLRLVFKGIGNGRIQIPGFYSEWSYTSFNL
jgi:hypothetical protein